MEPLLRQPLPAFPRRRRNYRGSRAKPELTRQRGPARTIRNYRGSRAGKREPTRQREPVRRMHNCSDNTSLQQFLLPVRGCYTSLQGLPGQSNHCHSPWIELHSTCRLCNTNLGFLAAFQASRLQTQTPQRELPTRKPWQTQPSTPTSFATSFEVLLENLMYCRSDRGKLKVPPFYLLQQAVRVYA